MTEAPSIALTVQLVLDRYYGLAFLAVLLQFIILAAMLRILTINPGILPQIVYRYLASLYSY